MKAYLLMHTNVSLPEKCKVVPIKKIDPSVVSMFTGDDCVFIGGYLRVQGDAYYASMKRDIKDCLGIECFGYARVQIIPV